MLISGGISCGARASNILSTRGSLRSIRYGQKATPFSIEISPKNLVFIKWSLWTPSETNDKVWRRWLADGATTSDSFTNPLLRFQGKDRFACDSWTGTCDCRSRNFVPCIIVIVILMDVVYLFCPSNNDYNKAKGGSYDWKSNARCNE